MSRLSRPCLIFLSSALLWRPYNLTIPARVRVAYHSSLASRGIPMPFLHLHADGAPLPINPHLSFFFFSPLLPSHPSSSPARPTPLDNRRTTTTTTTTPRPLLSCMGQPTEQRDSRPLVAFRLITVDQPVRQARPGPLIPACSQNAPPVHMDGISTLAFSACPPAAEMAVAAVDGCRESQGADVMGIRHSTLLPRIVP